MLSELKEAKVGNLPAAAVIARIHAKRSAAAAVAGVPGFRAAVPNVALNIQDRLTNL